MRNRNFEEHVGRHGIVAFRSEGDISIPEICIKTDVGHAGLFPGKVRILNTGGLISTDLTSTISTKDIIIGIECSKMRIVTNLEVTGLSVAGAQFQIVEPTSRPFHEVFSGNSPCGGN